MRAAVNGPGEPLSIAGELRGFALQQLAAELVGRDELYDGARSAAGADPVAADGLAIGPVVQHREHLALAHRAAVVGGLWVRIHRSTA